MHDPTLEVLDAVQVGGVRRREQTEGGDQEPRPVGDATVGVDGPDAEDLVEIGRGHTRLEVDVLTQVIAVHDFVQIGEDVGPLDELGVPRLVQVPVERVLVDEGLGVRQRARVLVPIPGAADPARLVDGHRVQAQLVAQLVQHVDPAETGADDEGVEVADLVVDESIHRACSFGLGDLCGVVHLLTPSWGEARTPQCSDVEHTPATALPGLIPGTQESSSD